jgi:hypothetical protein
MSTISRRTTADPVITRHFESSRHQRDNLVAAFEHALPAIRRRPGQGPTSRHPAPVPCRQRRAVS